MSDGAPVSAATMERSTETETAVAVRFDNLVLKWLLHSLGPVRRCELLKKLKTDLQNLGLSRKQVRRGLIQLATKPLVVLTRQQTARRRYGGRRRLFVDDDKEFSPASSNYTTDAPSLECNSRQGNENADRSHGVEVGAAEKAEALKAQNPAPTSDPKPTVLHPFDKALEQLDKIVSSKMNAPEKSVSKRSSVIVSVDTTCKSQNKDGASNKHSPPNRKTRVGIDNNRATERSFDLVSDQIPTNSISTPDRDKRYRIKLNLSSCFNHKKSESPKSNVNNKLDSNEKASAHVEEEQSPRNKIACPTRDSSGGKSFLEGVPLKGRTASSDNRVAEEDIARRILHKEDITHKRRLHGETNLDCAQKKRKQIRTLYTESKAIDKKKRKKVLKKFRTFFGDCVTVSEDEQDQDILEKQFKRRRKKDSVDSCDSGVCTAEGSAVTSYVEILKDIQRVVPDSTMHEEFNEAASKNTPAKARIINETKESNKDESIKTADQIPDTGNDTEVDRLEIRNEAIIVRSVEDVENCVEAEAVENVQNVTAVEAPVIEIITEIIELEDSPIFDGSIVQNTIATTDVTQTFQTTTKSTVDGLVPKAEAGIDATTTSPSTSEKCNGGAEGIKSEDFSGSRKRKHVEPRDMNELLRLNFNETCQITSNGNVLSIREHAEEKTNEGIDKNSNLKISTEVEVNNDDGPKDKEEAWNVFEKNCYSVHSKDTVISSDARQYDEAVPMNSNAGDASGSINKPVLQRSELTSTTEKTDTQPNNVPQARLRVLSSAELGSRWCPTPVAHFPTTVPPLSYANPIIMSSSLKATTVTNSIPSPAPPTQTVPAAAFAVPTPLVMSPPAETTSLDTTAKEYNDKDAVINDILSKIHDLFLSLRTSSLPSGVRVDKLLAVEFIKMKIALKVESFTVVIETIVKELNNYKQFKMQPLSLTEVFHYAPILKIMCTRESDNNAVQKPPAYVESQNAAPASTRQSPYPTNLTQICINISSAQTNFQENATLQPETNIVPTNMTMPANPAANPLLNTQQMNYRMDMQRPPSQQACIHRNRPVATNATQGGPLRHILVSCAAINQPRKLPPYPSNSSFMNRQYHLQSGFYASPAFYAANTSGLNHPMQQNVNPAKISQQQTINPHMVQQQNITTPPHMAQQQNINPPHMVQQQNINPPVVIQQQNINSHMVQQQNITSPHMAQQQNINPPYMVQQQNINPPVVIQQHNMYQAQRVQQQNINPIYMVQQQNIKHAPGMQQQNMTSTPGMQQQVKKHAPGMQQQLKPAPGMQQQLKKPAPGMQQQLKKPASVMQQQIRKPAPGMQQQTINPTHLIQQRAVNTPLAAMQQHTIELTNQQFQKTVHRKSGYNTTQGTAPLNIAPKLPQNAQQTVPTMNYIPQPVENIYVPSTSQPVPKNVRQSEPVRQAVPTQTQMMVLKNFVMEQMKASQDPQAGHSSRATRQPVLRENKTDHVAPASLESTIKQFYFLEYLSDIQKMMLVKHIDFYFNCTAWLEHGCPGQPWHTTESERFTLLNFQTVLKQIVDKMMNKLLRNEPSQGPAAAKNLLMGIKIDVPTVQIIVQDSNMIHCQVQVSKTEHVQCETVTLNECSTARQESLTAVEKQSQKKFEAADALRDTKSSDEAEGTKVLPKEEAQKRGPSTEQLQEKKQDKEATEVENHSEAVETVDTSMSNDSECGKNVTEKDSESCAPLCNTETNESDKTRENEVVASDSDQSNKDAKQPPNTHLVTVEISPNDDQVKVIDIDAARETRDTVIQRAAEKPEETEQKPNEEVPQPICAVSSPEDSTTCEVPTEGITDSPEDDIKYSHYTDIDTSLMEASPISFIADVRSISLEAFEKMEEGSDHPPTSVAEGNIEEEEIKICLFCSKPSTVACSLCLEAKYCSKACSELHWEEHYKICKPVDKSLYF